MLNIVLLLLVQQVNLSSLYNVTAIQSDGSVFSGDLTGYAYSATLLKSPVVANGVSFTLGPPNAPDAVTSLTIPVSGNGFSLLGTGINGAQTGTITLTYTDGSSSTLVQGFSDWYGFSSNANESIALTMAYRNLAAGVTGPGPLNIYAYTINSAKALASIGLPQNPNVIILAVTMNSPTASPPVSLTPPIQPASITVSLPFNCPATSPFAMIPAATMPPGTAGGPGMLTLGCVELPDFVATIDPQTKLPELSINQANINIPAPAPFSPALYVPPPTAAGQQCAPGTWSQDAMPAPTYEYRCIAVPGTTYGLWARTALSVW